MNVAPRPLNVCSLCAGIGGLDLGLRLAVPGARTVVYVERDAFAAACLVARMEDAELDSAPVWDDLESFDGGAWRGVVHCVAAGFPCQPHSLAGKRRGTDDERWIWPAIVRIVRDVEPGYVFLENVAGLLSSGGFHPVADSLAACGYRFTWDVFRASDVGAPHRRERVFILGARDVPDSGGADLRELAERGVLVEAERGNAEPGYVGGEDVGHADERPRNLRLQSRGIGADVGGAVGVLADSASRGLGAGKRDDGSREPDVARCGTVVERERESNHWATPSSRDWRDGHASEETMTKNARPLNEQAVSRWPTPNSEGGTGYKSGSNRDTWRPTLEGAALGKRAELHRGHPPQTTPTDGEPSSTPSRVLNPQFVEMLMGFPPGWTDCTPSATPSCRSKPRLRSSCSPTDSDGARE